MSESRACWVCGATDVVLVRNSTLPAELTSAEFAITSADYGRTAALYRCRRCSFLGAFGLGDVLALYEELEDQQYEDSRNERILQTDKLLDRIHGVVPSGRLLDVGAGSGTTVERALARGYRAQGVEPSQWLVDRAQERGLPVVTGTLPHADLSGPYDVVTVVDVVEHVTDPIELLRQVHEVLADDGVAAVITPDVSSWAARLLGSRWWHYRIAHVGYFDRTTLTRALASTGLVPIRWYRPGWSFRASYLAPRLHRYLPRVLRWPLPATLGRIIVPLNLLDSLLVLARRETPRAA